MAVHRVEEIQIIKMVVVVVVVVATAWGVWMFQVQLLLPLRLAEAGLPLPAVMEMMVRILFLIIQQQFLLPKGLRGLYKTQDCLVPVV